VKNGFYIEKQGTEKGDLKSQAALISRQATSLALKCSPSQKLLDKLQKALHDFNLEADTYLSETHEKSDEVPPVPNECVQDAVNGRISFKIPQVIKGPKNTRFKNVVEKKSEKKKKGSQKKGTDLPKEYNLCLHVFYNIELCFIVGDDLKNNVVETIDESSVPNQITVRYYLFSQFIPL